LAACSGGKPSATIHETVSVAAAIDSTVTSASCANGATVDLSGQLTLGGLTADLILRNNQKGTHQATQEAAATAVLVPANQTLSLQPGGGPPVAHPVLSVQFLDADGNPVSAEIALGPCGGGAFTVTAQATITATVTLDVDVAGCSNHPGPTITLTGAVTFGGLKAKL